MAFWWVEEKETDREREISLFEICDSPRCLRFQFSLNVVREDVSWFHWGYKLADFLVFAQGRL